MENYNANETDIEIECNLFSRILRPVKCAKTLNSNYSPILHVCMNARNGRERFNNIQFF